MTTRVIAAAGLQDLIDALAARGYTVLGPTCRDGAIAYQPVTSVDDLPQGWGDEQDAATYRLRRRDDDAWFGYACGVDSAKPVLFPADELLWSSHADTSPPTLVPADPPRPVAVLGVRACDLAAVAMHDTVLLGRGVADVHYARRRAAAFLVAVSCTDPGGTCFCASMGTGPVPSSGYDLALTELYADGPHRFVVTTGSARGEELLSALGGAEAGHEDLEAVERVGAQAAGRMGRTLDTDNLKNLLYDGVESPVWDQVAARCLACTSCTLVCPTCFCTSVDDVTDLLGVRSERHRVWDSCFSSAYSYIHGGPVRASTRSRYRQWLTHKLAAWKDQFGVSGCVGCGRCITWCPAGIDLTVAAAELRRDAAQRQQS